METALLSLYSLKMSLNSIKEIIDKYDLKLIKTRKELQIDPDKVVDYGYALYPKISLNEQNLLNNEGYSMTVKKSKEKVRLFKFAKLRYDDEKSDLAKSKEK